MLVKLWKPLPEDTEQMLVNLVLGKTSAGGITAHVRDICTASVHVVVGSFARGIYCISRQ
jgi:hypothetical protein